MTASAVVIQKKKNYLQRIRDAFKSRAQKRAERKEDEQLAAEFRGEIPEPFKNADPDEFRWRSPSFMMASFQKLILCVKNPDARELISKELEKLTREGDVVDGERKYYIRNRLAYTIFKEVTGEPCTDPNSNFWNLIALGIETYKRATPEVQAEFNRRILPNVKKGKVVVPVISQPTR